jgi:hypothetical protein
LSHYPDRDDVQAEIAQCAARLVAEGLTDYLAAKRKALKQLGLGSHHRLPSDREVEAALRVHNALFCSEEQTQALAALREMSLTVMHWLAPFEPWLTGAVLSGTANEHSAIELEVIGADIKALEMFLVNRNIVLDADEMQTKHAAFMLYRFTIDNVELVLRLFDSHADRAAASPATGLRHDRVQLNEARKRFC